ADLPGTYFVQLVGTNDGVASVPALVTISIANSCGSNPPSVLSVATKVGGVITARPAVGSSVTLEANALPGDKVVSGVCTPGQGQSFFQWTAVSLPAGAQVTLPQNGSFAFSFVPNVAGTYVFDVV